GISAKMGSTSRGSGTDGSSASSFAAYDRPRDLDRAGAAGRRPTPAGRPHAAGARPRARDRPPPPNAVRRAARPVLVAGRGRGHPDRGGAAPGQPVPPARVDVRRGVL